VAAKKDFKAYFEKIRSMCEVDASLEYARKDPLNQFTDPAHPLVRQFCRAAKEALGKDIPIA